MKFAAVGDARHFRDVKQIFEIMCLVHKEPVNAEFFKRKCVVLFFAGRKQFQSGFQFFLGGFQLLHGAPVVAVPFDLAQRAIQVVGWLWKKSRRYFSDIGIFSKPEWVTMICVPISRCDAAHQTRAACAFQNLPWSPPKMFRARIKHEQFGSELAEHMVRHGEHRLAASPSRFNSMPAATIV